MIATPAQWICIIEKRFEIKISDKKQNDSAYYFDRHSNILYIVFKEVSYMKGKISSDLIRGHTDTIILGILKDGDSYGYEIYKKIIEKSEGLYELKEATLYSSFRRLEKEGCILSYWGDETQGGRRKYYKITNAGETLYERNIEDWEFTKNIINKLL